MAGDAVVHRERLKRPCRRTFESFHWTVAGLAGDLAYCDVNAVREKHMGWQAPYSPPGDFLTAPGKGLEFLDFRVRRIAAGVAGETKSGGGPPGNQIFFGSLMAAGARDSLRDMCLMRKFYRLFDPRIHPACEVEPR